MADQEIGSFNSHAHLFLPLPSSTTAAGPQTTLFQTCLQLQRMKTGQWDTSRRRLESPTNTVNTDLSFLPPLLFPPREWVGVRTRPPCNHKEAKKFLESWVLTTSRHLPIMTYYVCKKKKKNHQLGPRLSSGSSATCSQSLPMAPQHISEINNTK